MTTETDWRHELDRAIPAPPTPYGIDPLAAGRRALLRRRATLGTAGLAAALVVAGTAWTLAPGSAPTSAPIATDPTSTTSPTAGPSQTTDPAESGGATVSTATLAPMADRPEDVPVASSDLVEDFDAPDAWPIAVLGNGQLVHQRGWEIESLYALESTGPQASRTRVWGVSAVPSGGGQARWLIVDWSPEASGMLGDRPGKRYADFEEWLDATWAAQRAARESGQAPPYASTESGRLEVADGVTVLESVAHPEEAAAYGPVETMVAAKVRLPSGRVVFLLAMPGDAVVVDPAVLEASTMDGFLAHLQSMGDNGEGLR